MPKTNSAEAPAAESDAVGPPRRRVRMDRVERRRTLLDAGAKAFAEGGFQGTSMEQVAKNASVTRLIIYRNFDTKEALYKAVLDRATNGIEASVSEQLAAGRTVAAVVNGFLAAARLDPYGFKLLVRHSKREAAFADYEEKFRKTAGEAARELIAGVVSDPALREWAAGTLVALLEEATLAWIETGKESRDDEMKAVLTRSIEAMLGSFSTNGRSR
jgi:AcrR family transcriptional regulator